MKQRLYKAGLLLMGLGIITAIIYSLVASYVISSVPHFDIILFCEVVLPAVFVFGVTFVDRLFGGILATIFSFIALIFCIFSRVSTVDTKADTAWFVITICFLLGGACILTSLRIRSPKKVNV
jgi:hypothetical protein